MKFLRCVSTVVQITEIKDSTPEPSLLLEYVDFPDEGMHITKQRFEVLLMAP